MAIPNPYNGDMTNFLHANGVTTESRWSAYENWLNARREVGVWPYWRTSMSVSADQMLLADEFGNLPRTCLNFSSQDYLSLAQSERVVEAAIEAIRSHGIHSAGSACLTGRSMPVAELERFLASVFCTDLGIVYPTGWAAGFGVLSGLARAGDLIVMDALVHNCLAEGAKNSGSDVRRFRHNDISDLELRLTQARKADSDNGIFVVIESLYSMDSDSPDLNAVSKLCHDHNAMLILDVAHDFGAMGASGLGLWESADSANRPDVVMGSFSKSFAANGGFVCCSRAVGDYLRVFSSSWVFSNALSPVQATIVLECLNIVFSNDGQQRRIQLRQNSEHLREVMQRRGFHVGGDPSPIVPVFVGDETTARKVSRQLSLHGLAANLVEFPAVPRGQARFRFQLMSSHTPEQIEKAAEIMETALREVTHS